MKSKNANNLPSTTRSLPISLIRARESIMLPIREMLFETDMTEQQWRILRVLSEYGCIDSKTLAERASLLMPSLTRIASTMSNKGLITQVRHEKDRRRQMVEITKSGQKFIDDHTEQALEIIDGFKDRLGEQNYETLLDLLSLLDSEDKEK